MKRMVRKMGWTNALGKQMQVRGQAGRVIGVVEDFNFKSLHTPIEPVAVFAMNMDYSGVADINKPFMQKLPGHKDLLRGHRADPGKYRTDNGRGGRETPVRIHLPR